MTAQVYQLGVDVGGTFTDFVVLNTETGALLREKCLTTPDDPVQGILNGIRRLRDNGLVAPGEISGVAHATTLITNTLIERKGVPTGLLATAGFRDVLELGTDTRYDMYDLNIEFAEPLVPRHDRLDIPERVDARGTALTAPRDQDIRAAVQALVGRGVRSIAIAFLHSYRNGAHERAVLDLIEREFPEVEVSLSSEVAPEIREYERTATVVANAYVKPIARSYLNRLEAELKANAVDAPILVMLSNGGMTTPQTAGDVPIRLVESGPAAGVLSACYAGNRTGDRDLVAFDMGGTTAKACFIDDGAPAFTGMFEAARIRRQFKGSGMPLKIPSVEMIEIGAGGGSIARIDPTGLLKVGPDSAGSKPGPVSYGLGGTDPTVTDADLVLGYLDPGFFLGGDMSLDLDGARRQIGELGRAAGLDLVSAAAGIAQVVNQNMATAVRIHAAERGKDFRKYAMFAFGGAGPVHAYDVARILGIAKVIYPAGAGTNSAFGMLAAPVAIDLSRSYDARLDTVDWDRLNALFADMEAAARKILSDAGVADPVFTRAGDMRFLGQGFEILTEVPNGPLSAASLPEMSAAFHANYRKIYDSAPENLPIEALTWRLRASGPVPSVDVGAQKVAAAARADRRRQVYFPEAHRYVDTPVINRGALRPGDSFTGPAVVEERESTAVIGPDASARIDHDFNLVVTLPGSPA